LRAKNGLSMLLFSKGMAALPAADINPEDREQ
jgi:hypothetical protein